MKAICNIDKFLFTGIFIFVAAPTWANSPVLYAWTQAAQTVGDFSVRAITTADSCPTVWINHAPRPMRVRARATANFPIMVCERSVLRDVEHLAVDHIALAIPPFTVHSILAIGDTGCKQKADLSGQDCDNPASWPFKSIAEKAAYLHSDLAIHTGDYIYRKITPYFVDMWAIWKSDFFEPASILLPQVAWIFARGNHENCNKSYDGWYRFFAAGPYKSSCNMVDDNFVVNFSNLSLFIHDSSNLNEPWILDQSAQNSIKHLSAFSAGYKNHEVWLLTHTPLISALHYKEVNERSVQAFQSSKLNFSLILSGHVHMFEYKRTQNMPLQVTIGMGGAPLVKQVGYGGGFLNQFLTQNPFHNIVKHGFGHFTFSQRKWHLDTYFVDGSMQDFSL